MPKRSSQRRRKNKESEPEKVKAPAVEVEQPAPEEDWHPIARAWYESLALSGQSVFYEPSDWATAHLIAESISRELKPQFVGMEIGVDDEGQQTATARIESVPMKGASLSAYLKAMTALLVTEGDRRRVGVELERAASGSSETGDDVGVTDIDEYRRRLAG